MPCMPSSQILLQVGAARGEGGTCRYITCIQGQLREREREGEREVYLCREAKRGKEGGGREGCM